MLTPETIVKKTVAGPDSKERISLSLQKPKPGHVLVAAVRLRTS
jgi:hypothetical protein